MGLSPKANSKITKKIDIYVDGNALPNIVDDIFKQEGNEGKELEFSLCYNS